MTAILCFPLAIDESPSYSSDERVDKEFREAQDDYYDGPALHHQPSRSYFRKLTRLKPKRMIELISGDTLDLADLTFAAEIAGEINDERLVVPTLLKLLDHESSLVREGAVYGLSNHLTDEVRGRLRLLGLNDASQGVRDAASDALED